ncbi:hypothetical protein QWY77_09685 [Thalassotalea ponticola]|uniref:hypothetical protein n=1 Tax=Thalassotalea ponticola TaxID=1523392 RepID=UPI0025B4F10D|nr:hypothetical protein [Thalassotalea ponticola]MDN3653024.1 hypothetical protein [Thalassotalea ponticola]
MKKRVALLTLSSAFTLFACGGSGDNNDGSQTNPDLINDNGIAGFTSYNQGQNADLLLYLPNDSVSDIQWQQTGGPSVTLLSDNTKAISFHATQTGSYSFDVSYQVDGQLLSEQAQFEVIASDAKIRLSRGHAVVETGNVSLRAFVDDNIDPQTLVWQQLSGPRVVFDSNNTDTRLALFSAPSVSEDNIVEIQVNGQTFDGETHSDSVRILIEDRPRIPSDAYFDDKQLANVYVYNQNSPYKDVLVNCAYSNQLTDSCRLGDLPLLAQDANGNTPTIEQIMDRVIVSHDWMAENFRQFLQAHDEYDDFKNLLRATTAIVLSSDIRPSFYWAATGAIYLDPDNLWLTAAERETINEAADFRSDFGDDLQFVIPWRYVRNNDYVSFLFPIEDQLNRSLNDLKYELSQLLYHELAHANDFLPSDEWTAYSADTSLLEAAVAKSQISTNLTRLYPLQSDEMRGLAEVRFVTGEPNALQRSYLPDDVVEFYRPDKANGFYNYTTEREDLAILFEEAMMSLRFNVQRDTAVTSVAVFDSDDQLIEQDSYIVAWGQRGRVSEEQIIDRAKYVTSRILAEVNSDQLDSLPSAVPMIPGKNWWDNLQLDPGIVSQSQQIAPAMNGHIKKLKPKQGNNRHGHLKPLPNR